MILKYNTCINNIAIENNLKRLINQIYKLLPTREEFNDWEKPLSTIIEEMAGMSSLFQDHHEILFQLLCKLEGLFVLKQETDFLAFRKAIFDILSLMNELIGICQI